MVLFMVGIGYLLANGLLAMEKNITMDYLIFVAIQIVAKEGAKNERFAEE